MSHSRFLLRRILAVILLVGMGMPLGSCVSYSSGSGITIGIKGGTKDERRESQAPRPTDIDWKTSLKTMVSNGVTIALLARLFKFEAPVKGREPVMVDFELAGKGTLQLDIWVEGAESATTLFFDGKAKQQLVKKKLPDELGDWQAAALTVSAYDKNEEAIDFCLGAIGIGDFAVGSKEIRQVTFALRETSDEESARWGFRSKRDFKQVAIEVFRRPEGLTSDSGLGCSGASHIRTLEPSCSLERDDTCEGTWDLRDKVTNRSTGLHRVAVKAWRSGTESDWVLRMSKEEVDVK